MGCKCVMHVFIPKITNGKPTSKYMAIVCFGEHSHPPPPPTKIPSDIKEQLLLVIKAFGVAECTARRLIASPILPLMLNGENSLTREHIALANHDIINTLIRKERVKEYPWGTTFQGAQFLMCHQLRNPYIQQTLHYPDGHFVVLCQLEQQSRLLFESFELQADKTFSRTACQEFEINSFSHSFNRSVTIARVFTDYEDGQGYHQAFELVFGTAEKDMGGRIPWGHIIPEEEGVPRVKAILVDEHGGQVEGLRRYFDREYPTLPGGDRDYHISKIVKTCRVHYGRSINKLANEVDPGIVS
jgi:hypothetical protein